MNGKGEAKRLSFEAAVIDEKGEAHVVTFKVAEKWDGTLKAGEKREVELITHAGPYLKVGSEIQVRITWRDEKGNAAALKTGKCAIERTD